MTMMHMDVEILYNYEINSLNVHHEHVMYSDPNVCNVEITSNTTVPNIETIHSNNFMSYHILGFIHSLYLELNSSGLKCSNFLCTFGLGLYDQKHMIGKKKIYRKTKCFI